MVQREGAGQVGRDFLGCWRLLPPCEVCGGSAPRCAEHGCRQCWGCAAVLHRPCAGLDEWPLGPFYCAACRQGFRAKGVRDVTLDAPLMHVVCGGTLDKVAEP